MILIPTPRPPNWPPFIRDPLPGDWVEDAADYDNGCYYHTCCGCKVEFIGHKRRPAVCKVCVTNDETEAKSRAEWLTAHSAPKDWVVLTAAEITAMKADLMNLVWTNSELKRALSAIHTTAHCVAKAGPLHTPTLRDAWGKFNLIGTMATAALAAAREKRLDTDPQPTQPSPL